MNNFNDLLKQQDEFEQNNNKIFYDLIYDYVKENPCPLTEGFYINHTEHILVYLQKMEIKFEDKFTQVYLRYNTIELNLFDFELTEKQESNELVFRVKDNIKKGVDYKTLNWDWFLIFKPIDNETEKIRIGKELLLKYIELYNIN